jgi:hypothetical protein
MGGPGWPFVDHIESVSIRVYTCTCAQVQVSVVPQTKRLRFLPEPFDLSFCDARGYWTTVTVAEPQTLEMRQAVTV